MQNIKHIFKIHTERIFFCLVVEFFCALNATDIYDKIEEMVKKREGRKGGVEMKGKK